MYSIITDLKTHGMYLNKYQFLGLAMLYRFQTRDWLCSDVNRTDSIRRLCAQGDNFVSHWKIKRSSGVQETACSQLWMAKPMLVSYINYVYCDLWAFQGDFAHQRFRLRTLLRVCIAVCFRWGRKPL